MRNCVTIREREIDVFIEINRATAQSIAAQ